MDSDSHWRPKLMETAGLIYCPDRGPIVAGVGLSLTRLSSLYDGIMSKLGDAVIPESTAVASK